MKDSETAGQPPPLPGQGPESRGGAAAAGASVATAARHLKLSKHKLVRASSSLMTQLRQQAADQQQQQQRVPVPSSPGRGAAGAALQPQAAHRANTWTRPGQQQRPATVASQPAQPRARAATKPGRYSAAAVAPAKPASLRAAQRGNTWARQDLGAAQGQQGHKQQQQQQQQQKQAQLPAAAQQRQAQQTQAQGIAVQARRPVAGTAAATLAAKVVAQLAPAKPSGAAQPGRSHTWTRQPQQQRPGVETCIPSASATSSTSSAAAANPAAARSAPLGAAPLAGKFPAVKPAPATANPAASKSEALALKPLLSTVADRPPATARGDKSVVAVLTRSADGQQQQRVLVYKKGKGGASLRRTAVKAAARGSLSWRNPATSVPGSAKALAGEAGKVAAGGGRAGVSAGQMRASGMTVAAKGSGGSVPVQLAGGSSATQHRSSKKKWHKYVRAAVTAAAVAKTRQDAATAHGGAVKVATLTGGGSSSSSSRGGGGGGGGGAKSSRLLRLGSSVYHVLGRGRSRSLQRQPSLQLPSAAPGAPAAPRASAAQAAATAELAAATARQAGGSVAAAAVEAGGRGAAAGASGVRRLSRYKLVSAAALAAAAAAAKAGLLVKRRISPAAKPAGTAPAGPTAAAGLKARGGVVKVKGSSGSDGNSLGAKPQLRHRHKLRQQQAAAPASAGIVYCPVYCRTGKCERRNKGCPFKHDTTKRCVCPRWLHGHCELGTKCPLQHQRKEELMPVCQHFLAGRCTADACPYLHVNLPPSAPVCKRFLRGYCPAGAACPHKHYTLRMVREEKALGGGSSGVGDSKRKGAVGAAGRKRAACGRYFDAPPAASEPSTIGAAHDTGVNREDRQDGQQQDAEAEPLAKRPRHPACTAAQRQGSLGAAGGDAAGEGLQGSAELKPAFLCEDYVPL